MFLLFQVPGASSSPNEDVITMIKTMLLLQLTQLTEERIETITFSSVGLEKFTNILSRAGLTIKSIPVEGRLPKDTVAAYCWSNYAQNNGNRSSNTSTHILNHYFPNVL